jgi:hypothetical protein
MPPKSARSHALDYYAADRCTCNHLVYEDDAPGGECRFCGCENHQSANRPAGQKAAAPDRCPGYTCELGRTHDWIDGQGKIDGQHYDLPPGHFWYRDGGYLAHTQTAEAGGES